MPRHPALVARETVYLIFLWEIVPGFISRSSTGGPAGKLRKGHHHIYPLQGVAIVAIGNYFHGPGKPESSAERARVIPGIVSGRIKGTLTFKVGAMHLQAAIAGAEEG